MNLRVFGLKFATNILERILSVHFLNYLNKGQNVLDAVTAYTYI